MNLLLLFGGVGIGIIWPGLQSYLFEKDAKSLDKGLCLLLVVLFGIFSFLMVRFTKGFQKNKGVLFDVGHGTTESPLVDYNLDIQRSAEFGHARLVDLLGRYGFHFDFVETITSGKLSKTSILVLIMPSKSYETDEINAIEEFVSNGGGLLVIGDHTDINHVMSALNPVIQHFGIRFRFDTLWLQTNDRANLLYRYHPALFDLEKVNFSVGASLDIHKPARPVIQSTYTIFSDLGDPNNATHAYLGNVRLDPGEKINDLCLIADCLYGNGRVFVMGDSSYFQNTSIYQNWMFVYRLFDWLNHTNQGIPARNLMLLTILIGILFLSGLMSYRRSSPSVLFSLMVIALLFSIWMAGISNLKRFPKPGKRFKTILVDMAHQNEYSLYWISREKADTCLDGMIGQIIRTGLFPAIHTNGLITKNTLSDHEAIFTICPNKPFHTKEIEAIAHFVENGGGLLLVEGPRKWAVSNALWERFGLYKDRYPLSVIRPVLSPIGLPIKLQYGNFRAQFIPHPVTNGISTINMVNPCKVQGGFPIAFIENIPVMNFMEFGEGKLLAIGDDRFFANYMTEFQEKVVDPDKLRLIWNLVDYFSNG